MPQFLLDVIGIILTYAIFIVLIWLTFGRAFGRLDKRIYRLSEAIDEQRRERVHFPLALELDLIKDRLNSHLNTICDEFNKKYKLHRIHVPVRDESSMYFKYVPDNHPWDKVIGKQKHMLAVFLDALEYMEGGGVVNCPPVIGKVRNHSDIYDYTKITRWTAHMFGIDRATLSELRRNPERLEQQQHTIHLSLCQLYDSIHKLLEDVQCRYATNARRHKLYNENVLKAMLKAAHDDFYDVLHAEALRLNASELAHRVATEFKEQGYQILKEPRIL